MNLFSLVLFIHVGAALLLTASSVGALFVRTSLRSAATVREVSGWTDFAKRTTRANPPASMVLLATGIYLGSSGWWSSGWFAVSVALFVLNGAYAARALVGETERIAALAAQLSDGPVPASLDELRWSERLDLGLDILLGADLAVLFLMTNKPSLPGAVAIAALGVGSALVWRGLRRRARPLAEAR